MISIRNLDKELKCKQICRFCLTTMRPLSNIYSAENKDKYLMPLSLQIVSVSAIEVFPSDKLPSTICDQCNGIMDFCYRFKQMCKEADSKLQQFPNSGIWPDALQVPDFPRYMDQHDQILFEDDDAQIEILKIDNVEMVGLPEPPTPPPPPPKLRKIERIPAKSLPISVKDTESPIKAKPKVLNQITTSSKPLAKIESSPPRKGKPKVLNQISTTAKVLADSDEGLTIKRNKFGNVDILMESPEACPEVLPTEAFPCQHCYRTFPLKQLLEIHERNHSRERDHQCDSCPKKFFTKYDLAKHVLTHTGERPFQCVVCQKSFSRCTLLYRHERVHANVPRFNCDSCDRFFFREEDLKTHTEKHNRSRPFKCRQCPKSFAFKQGLDRHEISHSNQPHACEYCRESFSTRHQLLRHIKAHAGDRPYPCKFCPKSFLMSHHLTRHLRSHAGRENNVLSFKCLQCGETRATPKAFIQHLIMHGPTSDHRCPLCKEQFANEDDTKKHIEKHQDNWQFPCEFCDLMFLDEEALLRHCLDEHVTEHELYATVKEESVSAGGGEKQKPNAEEDEDSSSYEIIDLIKFKDENSTSSSRKAVKRLAHVDLKDENADEVKKGTPKTAKIKPSDIQRKTDPRPQSETSSSTSQLPKAISRAVIVRGRSIRKDVSA